MIETRFQDEILPLKDKLFRLALRITLNRADAEDVTQETLIRMWDKRHEWHQMDSTEAYALAVCRNLAIDQTGKASRKNLTLDETRDKPAPGTPHEELDARQRLHIVKQLMESLPEVQRTIIELRDIEGMAYKEIAQAMELSEQQVKVYLFRARQKIKNQFKKIDGHGL